ncbi:MAG: SURF1 family protein [Burkholderiales bacterium]|nr:SURF1 family protein [Burkholderiales bacterium]
MSRLPSSEQAQERAGQVWLSLLLLFFSGVFLALGAWQLQRLQWKVELISQVHSNTKAERVQVGSAQDLELFSTEADAYRQVLVRGRADCTKALPVWASTALGTGYWWMVPVELSDGSWLWLNRGYVGPGFVKSAQSSDHAYRKSAACGQVSASGLLRSTQTGGGFLRGNNLNQGRWYSRDALAMAQAQSLPKVNALWFVDEWPAVENTSPGHEPVPGLTPLNWPNRHLGYAITWSFLSLMALTGAVFSSARARHFVVKCTKRLKMRIAGGKQRGGVGH